MYNAQDASYAPSAPPLLREWSSKHGEKNYALEVIQNPIRARMCGFGDKDRRPLAPAAVARLLVTDENNRIVSPESIQAAFFIVLVDLWDEEGQKDCNLVRVPTQQSVSAKRNRHVRTESSPSVLETNGTSYTFADSQSPFVSSSMASTSTQVFDRQRSPTSPTRSLTVASPVAKRKRSKRANEGGAEAPIASGPEQVPTHPFYPQDLNAVALYPSAFASQDLLPFTNYISPSYAAMPPNATYTSGISVLTPNGQSLPQEATTATTASVYVGHDTLPQPVINGSMQPPPPWSTDEPAECARTLIGPLAAGAQLLTDDNDEPGIFFLFQDLSVRKEGVFRLRMRLVNVGGPPAPEPGATRVRSDSSTVLAQVFTQPFTVFSAKKFPGVPPTTALSKKLLQQGLKIPGRTRNKDGPAPRKKRRLTDAEEWAPDGALSNSEEE